jgi:hypothetical protein
MHRELLFLALKTHTYVKEASSVHDIFVSRPYPQHVVVIRKISSTEDDHLETLLPTTNCINTNNPHDFEELRLGWSQFPCESDYNLHTAECRTTMMALSLAGTGTVRGKTVFVSAYVLHLTSHGQIATVVAKCERLDDVDQNNVESVPLNQYQLDYQRHSGLTL